MVTPRKDGEHFGGALQVESRFWSKVEKSGFCWTWLGAKNPKGYGAFSLNGKAVAAHRLAFQLSGKRIPKGFHVLHTCDNPSCVRPDHLYAGTNTDNANDRISKGRVASAENAGQAKLTNKQVAEIRKSYTPNPRKQRSRPGDVTQAILAARYGVSGSVISEIISGKTYKV